jgi:hypothetical protein
MKTTTTLNALAASVTLALTLGLAGAAHAGDFEDAYPAFAEAQAQKQQQATGLRVVIQAPRPRRNPLESVSTDESRAQMGEDSGSFWLAQQQAKPATTTLARAAALSR